MNKFINKIITRATERQNTTKKQVKRSSGPDIDIIAVKKNISVELAPFK